MDVMEILINLFSNNWTWIGVISSLVLILAKVLPEENILKFIHKPLFGLGVLISKTLVLRIGKKATENFETGIFKTLLTVISFCPMYILDGMLSDNEKIKEKNAKKHTKNS